MLATKVIHDFRLDKLEIYLMYVFEYWIFKYSIFEEVVFIRDAHMHEFKSINSP